MGGGIKHVFMVTQKRLEDVNLGPYLNLSVIIHNYLGLLLVISMN